MKIYAALGTHSSRNSNLGVAVAGGVRNVLVAFSEGRQRVVLTVMEARRRDIGVFLDSGAFSAFTYGLRVDIGEYIALCLAVQEIVDEVACLDVIGDPVGTERNQRRMEDAGLRPLVTCHLGMDPLEVVDRFSVSRKGALGGMAAKGSTSRATRQRWLDKVFNEMTRSSSWPIRIHGYGMTDGVLLERFPWYSVDSSSWAVASWRGGEIARNGRHIKTVRSSIDVRGVASDVARAKRSLARINEYADYCTRLWTKRGVTWDS